MSYIDLKNTNCESCSHSSVCKYQESYIDFCNQYKELYSNHANKDVIKESLPICKYHSLRPTITTKLAADLEPNFNI